MCGSGQLNRSLHFTCSKKIQQKGMQVNDEAPLAYWHPRIVTVSTDEIYISLSTKENEAIKFGETAKLEFQDSKVKACWVQAKGQWRVARRHFVSVHHYLMKNLPVQMPPAPPRYVVEEREEYGSDEVRFAVCRLCAGEVVMKCVSVKCGCETKIAAKPIRRRTLRQK